MAAFKPNPLSLSVPDPALDRWLRDSGYLDLLDSTAASASVPAASPSTTTTTTNPASPSAGVAVDVLAFAPTLASLLALNPLARLSAADLAGSTPSWSRVFVGPPGAASYSGPPTPTQARLRVQENVRRYARNYVALSILVFAYFLYRMPKALLGMLASGAVWEGCATAGTIGGTPPGHPVLRRHFSTVRSYCYIVVPMQHAVCACICHWVELCSDDVARFSSEINSHQPS